MPRSAYFVGKVVQVLAVTVVIIAVLLLIGVVFYDIKLPSGRDWITFAWVTALGASACTLLGVTRLAFPQMLLEIEATAVAEA